METILITLIIIIGICFAIKLFKSKFSSKSDAPLQNKDKSVPFLDDDEKEKRIIVTEIIDMLRQAAKTKEKEKKTTAKANEEREEKQEEEIEDFFDNDFSLVFDDSIELPANIQSYIDSKYPNAQIIVVNRTLGIRVKIKDHRMILRKLTFNLVGECVATRSILSYDELPEAIKTAFKNHPTYGSQGNTRYGGWGVTTTSMIERLGKDTVYAFKIELAELEACLYYTAEGVLLQDKNTNYNRHHLKTDIDYNKDEESDILPLKIKSYIENEYGEVIFYEIKYYDEKVNKQYAGMIKVHLEYNKSADKFKYNGVERTLRFNADGECVS